MMGVGRLYIACVLALLGGCLHDDLTSCGDLVCARGMTCVPQLHDCYPREQLTPCDGKADGDTCVYGLVSDGVCRASVCVPATCGDGVITAPEQCDGTALA